MTNDQISALSGYFRGNHVRFTRNETCFHLIPNHFSYTSNLKLTIKIKSSTV